MNPFELLKALFTKSKPNVQGLELGINIVINQWLSLMPEQARKVATLVDYFFYINPIHYYYLLYFNVQGRMNFVKKPKSEDISDNLLLLKVQTITRWTDREMYLNSAVLKETILKNESYWKQQLGVIDGKNR